MSQTNGENKEKTSDDKSVDGEEIQKGNDSKSGEGEKNTFQQRCYNWITLEKVQVIFNGLLTLFTIIYAGITYKQWSVADTATTSSIAATRAWIGVDEWVEVQIKDSRFSGGLVLKNVGATAATSIKLTYETVFFEEPFPMSPSFVRCPTKVMPSIGVASGGQAWGNTIHSDRLNESQLEKIKSRSARIYIHICVTYRDVIIPSQERITEAAYSWPLPQVDNALGIEDRYFRMK